jgi:predicted MFS family arabinose efflux permease
MAVFGTSSVLGPVIGGFFAGQSTLLGITGWRWIFYINVPLGIAAFLVVMRVLHLPHTRRDHRIDWPGALALITCLVPLLIVAEQGRTWGWASGRSVLCYAIGAVGLIAFILAERAYKDDALLPLRLFRNRSFSVGSVSSIVLGAGMFGGILLLPQYLQIVHGSSPTVAGLQMIPLVAGIMTGAMGSGIAISKTGKYKIYPLVGVVFIVAALVAMSFIIAPTSSVWSLVPFMVLLGVGLGFNFQPVVLAVQNAVRPNEMGVATSSVTFFRQMGGTIGVAAFLSILFTRLPTDIASAAKSAIAANPSIAPQFASLKGSNATSDTAAFLAKAPAAVVDVFKTGFTSSISLVFLVAAAVVAIGFFVLVFLPEVALRNESGIQAQQSGAGEITGKGTAVTPDVEADQPRQSVGAAAPTSTAPPSGQPEDPRH